MICVKGGMGGLGMPGAGERIGAVLLAVALMISNNEANARAASAADSDVETSVCGMLREPLAFWRFRLAAGAPETRRVALIRDIERPAIIIFDLGGPWR